jgi:fatty-acyl-CoA synthase
MRSTSDRKPAPLSRSAADRNHETIRLFVTNTDQAVIAIRSGLCRESGLLRGRSGCHNLSMETPLSPLEFARRTRRLHADREAVVDGELRLTYRQFFDRCDRWSAALQELGVAPSDRVATIAPNTHAQLESFYAVPQIGAVLVPINYRLTAEDFVYIVNHSGASVVCVHSDYLKAVDSVRDQMPGVRHFVAYEGAASEGGAGNWLDYETAIAAAEPSFERPEIGERDLLSINYTSGTTARPKGVMITHRNAALNTIGTLLHLPMGVGERYLWTLPMFHANGWTYTWTVTAAAATHICLRKVDPATIFALIREEKVNWLSAAPTVLISLASAPPSVRGEVPPGIRVTTAGAPPAAATIERLEGEFGWEITQVYGLTETAPFITVCAPLPEHEGLPLAERAVIKARTGVELLTSGELRVVDPDGHEVPADGQTVGEIIVRGNVVMEGYYHDPEATQRAMGDGWFHTGDAAVVHPDGYAEIRDRLKDVIISGGENISSVEVEGVLLRHPAVQEAAIVGLPHERWGETPHAFVVLRDGASASEADIIAFAREHLAHFKAPSGVTFTSELPKTATGKIQKYVLRSGAPNLARQ